MDGQNNYAEPQQDLNNKEITLEYVMKKRPLFLAKEIALPNYFIYALSKSFVC